MTFKTNLALIYEKKICNIVGRPNYIFANSANILQQCYLDFNFRY